MNSPDFACWIVIIWLIVFACALVVHLAYAAQFRNRQRCTQKGTAILTQGCLAGRNLHWRKVRFTACNGQSYDACVKTEFIEASCYTARTGEQVPVLYDPRDPMLVIIGENTIPDRKIARLEAICRILAIIVLFGAAVVFMMLTRS